MNIKAVLIAGLLFTPVSALAQQRVYTESYCYMNTEEYVPGYYNNSGEYVSGYVKTDRRRVPCGSSQYSPVYTQPSAPRCSAARTTLGGLLGGGAAAALSKQDAYGWSIPLGAVLGMGMAQAGCN
jgi:hypothetical protein